MPWTGERYPAAMRRLPPRVRQKAVDIANALLAEGCDDGKAIRIGIAKAKEWARRQRPGAGRYPTAARRSKEVRLSAWPPGPRR